MIGRDVADVLVARLNLLRRNIRSDQHGTAIDVGFDEYILGAVSTVRSAVKAHHNTMRLETKGGNHLS